MKNFDYEAFKALPLPSEAMVMANWKGNKESPVISVLCATFNQEAYIEDALHGFLIQRTDFPFEIIIHDDASGDNTPNILKKYKSLYPNIINLVLQSENQYSQGKKVMQIIANNAKAEYLALCEGDDFWIESEKLQKQYDALSMSGSDICFSHAISLFPDFRQKEYVCNNYYDNFLPLNHVIRLGGGFMPTASLMIKRQVYIYMPDWYHNAPVGDAFIQIIASLNKPAFCLPLTTVVYRESAEGSWSSSRKSRDSARIIADLEKMIRYLDKLSEYEEINLKDLDYIKASLCIEACGLFIDLKCYNDFQFYLGKSLAYYGNHCVVQNVYRYLRYVPHVLYGVRFMKWKVGS